MSSLGRDQRQGFDGLEELIGLNGFGNVGVHSGGEPSFSITFHGMGGHGNDRMLPVQP